MRSRLRPHPVVWLQQKSREWWPFFAALAAVCLIATLTWVTYTVVDERRYFEEEAARDRRQDAALTELLERQEAADQRSKEEIATALDQATVLLDDLFARHDRNVAMKLNDLLAQIAALLDRPVGAPPSPATTFPLSPGPTAEPTPVAPITPTHRTPGTPEPTTTTTTPDQRRCAHHPDHPRC